MRGQACGDAVRLLCMRKATPGSPRVERRASRAWQIVSLVVFESEEVYRFVQDLQRLFVFTGVVKFLAFVA